MWVLSGRLQVTRGARRLEELGQDAIIGESALVEDTPRGTTIIALEKTELLVLNRDLVHGLMMNPVKIILEAVVESQPTASGSPSASRADSERCRSLH